MMGMIVAFCLRKRNTNEAAITLAMMAAVTGFFALLMLFAGNPFELAKDAAEASDGRGLNPLLQNLAMVFHPPLLFLGYAGFTPPFAILVAALLTGREDKGWLDDLRPWAIAAWLFLSVGILLGAQWAYVELSWGGYWAWDAVENASLLPWLTGTAMLHSIAVFRRRGMFKRWAAFLIAGTFLLCIFGTYITRSGIVQSVHSFGESPIGTFFLVFMSLLAGFAHFMCPEADLRVRCLSLVPTDAARPHSSLGHMTRLLMQHFGDGRGGWFLGQTLDVAGLRCALHAAIAEAVPVLVLATSLAIQAWMDAWPAGETLVLPRGSRLMDTGGPKGRTQLTDRAAQHAWLARTLGLDPALLVGEFGMTELATPRYETTLRARLVGDTAPVRAYAGPPWLGTVVLDPATQQPVKTGETGMLAHIDLANLDTPAFVLTADLGRAVPLGDGREAIALLGRVPGAEWRGCGLDVDDLLAEMR